MDELPDPIIIQIFEYLNPSERILIEEVCKRWYYLGEAAWTKFNYLKTPSLPNTCNMIEMVLSRCGKYLKILEILEFESDPENMLSIVAQNCPNLEKFSFNSNFPNTFLDLQLSSVFRKCSHLTTVDLSKNKSLTGRCFSDVPAELKCLRLGGCLDLKNKYIQIIADRCSNLELLDFNCCNQITVGCLEYSFQKLPKLRVLHFGSYIKLQEEMPPTMALYYLNQLREIYLSFNRCVNNETLNVISRACSCVEKIDVSGCHHITDVGLCYLCNLKHLTELDLKVCYNITDTGVKLLAELESLKVLYLFMCRNITDDSVIRLAEYCINLNKLDLSFTEITDQSVWAFYNNVDKKAVKLTLCVENTKVLLEKSRVYHPMLEVYGLTN